MKSYLVQSDSNLLKIVNELGKERKDLLAITYNMTDAQKDRLSEIEKQVQNIIDQVVGKNSATPAKPETIDASALFNPVP